MDELKAPHTLDEFDDNEREQIDIIRRVLTEVYGKTPLEQAILAFKKLRDEGWVA